MRASSIRIGQGNCFAVATALLALVFLSAGASAAEFVHALTDSGNPATNGTNLRNAVNAAMNRAGDTRITLPAGVSFEYPIDSCYLPNKTLDNGYVTIESANMASLPGPGVRVSPADAVNMPKIRSMRNGIPVFRTNFGAHHYRLRGLEITAGPGFTFSELVKIGEAGSTQDLFSEVPHHIEIDRCYVHPDDTNPGFIVHCFSIHSASTTVSNCYVENIRSTSEAQAIWICNGTGPYFFVNNFLEGAGENFMSGGGATFLPNGTIPADVTFRRNYFYKRLEWRTVTPALSVKNLFEIKFGRRFDIQGNVFENMWVGSQDAAINLKVAGNNPDTLTEIVTEDVLFRDNKVLHAPTGLVLQGRNWGRTGTVTEMRRMKIINNLWEDLSRTNWGSINGNSGSWIQMDNGSYDTVIEHNTAFNEKWGVAIDNATWPHSGLIFRDNICQASTWTGDPARVFRNSTGYESTAILWATTSPPAIVTHNIFRGATASLFQSQHTPVYTPSSWTGVLDANHNVINPTMVGSDGVNPPGANMTTLNAATVGCTTGAWAANDIVLHAAEAPTRVGAWTVTTDATAAGGSSLRDADAGAALVNPQTSPAHYFEMTFSAMANTPYRIWLRGKADANNGNNDSCSVQFSNSVSATGAAIWRIGTTSAHVINLQNAAGATLSNWGWQDKLYTDTSVPPIVRFATSGTQTIRIQRREDGMAIDQIVLSPATFLGGGAANVSPGTLTDDTTLLAKALPAIVAPMAFDSFAYTVPGSLNGQSGGDGFGANAWTGVTGQASPALAAGSMPYSDGTRSITISGNRLQPASTSRSTRNLPSVYTTANTTLWVAFRINQTDATALPTNHAGFSLFSGTGGLGTSEIFLGKPASATNWGMYHAGTVQTAQRLNPVTTTGGRDAFLVYKLVFTTSNVAISMWVNPSLASEASLPTPHATLNSAHSTNIASVRISTGTNSVNYQFDEFRMGSSFAAVTQ